MADAMCGTVLHYTVMCYCESVCPVRYSAAMHRTNTLSVNQDQPVPWSPYLHPSVRVARVPNLQRRSRQFPIPTSHLFCLILVLGQRVGGNHGHGGR